MAASTGGAEGTWVEAGRLAQRLLCPLGLRQRSSRVELEQLACAFSRFRGGGAKEPVGTDFLEALGEDMLEKPRDEAVDGQGEALGLLGAGIDVAESDAVVFEGFDAIVGQSDPMDVAGEILGGVLTVAGELRMDVPTLAEDSRIDLIEQARLVEGVADLGAKNGGEGVSGDEKAAMGRLAPGFAVFGQTARCDEQMDVGVVGEVGWAPSMKRKPQE
jgi:hypothetical protein